MRYDGGEHTILALGIVLLIIACAMIGRYLAQLSNARRPYGLLVCAKLCALVGVFGFILPSVAMAQSHHHTQKATHALGTEAQKLGVTVAQVDVAEKARHDGSFGSAVLSKDTCAFRVSWKRPKDRTPEFAWATGSDTSIITHQSLDDRLQRDCTNRG